MGCNNLVRWFIVCCSAFWEICNIICQKLTYSKKGAQLKICSVIPTLYRKTSKDHPKWGEISPFAKREIKFKLIILKAITTVHLSLRNRCEPGASALHKSMHLTPTNHKIVNMFAHMHRIIIETSVNRYALDGGDDDDVNTLTHWTRREALS